MTIREELEVLNRTKTMQRLLALRNPPPPAPIVPEVIDWIARRAMRNQIFKKYVILLLLCAGAGLVFVTAPLLVVHPPYGNAFMMSIPPMFFMSFTWMLGCWWAFDKERHIFFCVTMGAIPIRLVLSLLWGWMVLFIPNVDQTVFFYGSMVFWLLFCLPEIGMILEMSNKLKCTSQIEPEEDA